MNYSFSTVLMTILASNLIIALIAICFYYERILISVGYKLLTALLVLTVFRFLFPFELPFAKSIYMPEEVSMLIALIRYVFAEIGFFRISLWFVFECVWMVGLAIELCKSINRQRASDKFITKYGKDITADERVKAILMDACGKKKNSFRVITIPALTVPQIFDFKSPCILIPQYMDLDSAEFKFALQHEVHHYLHHDLLIKKLINFLCIIYWWNPLCGRFRRQIELTLEMHVDDAVVNNNREVSNAYGHAVLQIAEAAVEQEALFQSEMSIGLIKPDCQDLTKRFHMLYRKERRVNVPLFLFLLLVTFSIYVGSYAFVLEASYHNEIESNEEMLQLSQDFRAIQRENGTYDVFYNEILLENVSSLEFYRDVPVIAADITN